MCNVHIFKHRNQRNSLKIRQEITKIVNSAWDSSEFLAKVTPITQDLLRFWFFDAFVETRHINFHVGQRQAILNTIYAHEILKPESVFDLYSMISNEIPAEMDLTYLKKISSAIQNTV